VYGFVANGISRNLPAALWKLLSKRGDLGEKKNGLKKISNDSGTGIAFRVRGLYTSNEIAEVNW